MYNVINSCPQCNMTQNNKHKRDPIKPKIINFPKKRYIVDITYLSTIFGDDYKYPYLLILEEHLSKFAMVYLLHNKDAETVLKKIKNFAFIMEIQRK